LLDSAKLKENLRLKLVDSKVYKSGSVLLRYLKP